MASRARSRKSSSGARRTSGVSQGAGRLVSQARVSVGPAGEELDPADRLDKLEVFLQDFDREVLARKQQFQAVVSSVLQGLDNCYSMRITSLPTHVRAMSLADYKAMDIGDEKLEQPLEELLEADLVLNKAVRIRGKRAGGGKRLKTATSSGFSRGEVTGGEGTEPSAAQERGHSYKKGATRKIPARKAKSSSQATNPKGESSFQKADNGNLTGKLKRGFNSKSASSMGVNSPPAFGLGLDRTPIMYRTRLGSKQIFKPIRTRGTTEDNPEQEMSISQALIGLADRDLDVNKMDSQMFEKMVKLKDKLLVLCQNPGSSQS